MFMAFAIAELSGSNIMTMPLKSSLRLVDLHFGHTFSLVMKWQFVHAFSFIPGQSYSALLSSILLSFAFFSGVSFVLAASILTHSTWPRKGCLAVTPIFPELPPLP